MVFWGLSGLFVARPLGRGAGFIYGVTSGAVGSLLQEGGRGGWGGSGGCTH